MNFLRMLFVCLFALASVACSLFSQKENLVFIENQALIKEQSALIDEQAVRLNELMVTQNVVASQVASVQAQVNQISGSLEAVLKATQANAQNSQVSPPLASRSQAPETASIESGKAVLGRVEYVWLDGAAEYAKARIDTGAKSSALHAAKIQPFERDGEPWVGFELVMDEKPFVMEAPLVRYVRVKQSSASELDRRPVVKLKVNLGELREETEFTLSNRKEMLYPVLLGRSFLQDIAVVDVAKKFTRSRDPKFTAQPDQ